MSFPGELPLNEAVLFFNYDFNTFFDFVKALERPFGKEKAFVKGANNLFKPLQPVFEFHASI